MMEILVNVLKESIKVSLLVLIMMIAVDFINVKTKGKLELLLGYLHFCNLMLKSRIEAHPKFTPESGHFL